VSDGIWRCWAFCCSPTWEQLVAGAPSRLRPAFRLRIPGAWLRARFRTCSTCWVARCTYFSSRRAGRHRLALAGDRSATCASPIVDQPGRAAPVCCSASSPARRHGGCLLPQPCSRISGLSAHSHRARHGRCASRRRATPCLGVERHGARGPLADFSRRRGPASGSCRRSRAPCCSRSRRVEALRLAVIVDRHHARPRRLGLIARCPGPYFRRDESWGVLLGTGLLTVRAADRAGCRCSAPCSAWA